VTTKERAPRTGALLPKGERDYFPTECKFKGLVNFGLSIRGFAITGFEDSEESATGAGPSLNR
jgi:hypothetical protein